jgi:hypothetical protein
MTHAHFGAESTSDAVWLVQWSIRTADARTRNEVKEGLADTEFRSVLFWVNLARKDKQVEASALVVQPEEIPVRQEGEATVRVLVGEGSPVQLGTLALILDIELPEGGQVTTQVPAEFQGFDLRVGRRGRLWCQPSPSEAATARPSRER